MAESERRARVVALLEGNVRTEIQVVNAMLDLGLTDHAIERLAAGVTSGILYAFEVDWSPDWVRPGELHSWQDGGAWFARCPTCLEDSPPADNGDEAEGWARRHGDGH